MKEDDLKCCGSCCWFKHEDTDGFGVCYRRYPDHIPYCGEDPCKEYVSNKEARHHVAVLIQANRYRRDQNVPAIYSMPDPKDLGAAIDFATMYIKQFSEI
jgi:hypothetical protein